METSHDQNCMCKTIKIWCKTCIFYCKKCPYTTCILFIIFFLSYLFFPWVFTFLFYSSILVGLPCVGYKAYLLRIDRQKNIKQVDQEDDKSKRVAKSCRSVKSNQKDIKQVEEDDKRIKFAKSCRSFKSNYSDRSRLIHRKENSEEKDDFFSKTLDDLLFGDEKPREIEDAYVKSILGIGDQCSSSNDPQSLRPNIYGNITKANNNKDKLEGKNSDISDNKDADVKPRKKAVQWTADRQKKVMDLGISEAERNKRLESMIMRRKSRKNIDFQDELGINTDNNDNVQVSAIKTATVNPFLERDSSGKKSPGTAQSFLLPTRNPFDIPYDPHEEKLDLTGDDFHEEFKIGQPKEAAFRRQESFSIAAFTLSQIARTHDRPLYTDLSTKEKSVIGLGTSTVGDNHPKEEGESSEKDRTERKTREIDAHLSNAQENFQKNIDSNKRKPDNIGFFYGGVSSSVVSDMQVEVSDEGSGQNLSYLSEDGNNPDQIISNQMNESSGAASDQTSHATLNSPKSVLHREYSTDPSSRDT